MNKILVVADVVDGQLKKVTKEILSHAKKTWSDAEVYALIFGDESHNETLKQYGADHILLSDLSDYSPEGYAHITADLARQKDIDVILTGHTYVGKDFTPRVAGKLNCAILSDVTDFRSEDGKVVVTKPLYSGKAIGQIAILTRPAVITVRPNSLSVEEVAGKGEVEKVSIEPPANATKFSGVTKEEGQKIQLTEAEIIVSGGRGVKGPEYFQNELTELCNVIGAALGASRAAVDAGWISHDHQVGQTGKTVSPNLYIAIGISGAIQHLAGMGTSKYIVAINKDPDAPIFKVATYGIVADLFEIVPALIKEFKEQLGK